MKRKIWYVIFIVLVIFFVYPYLTRENTSIKSYIHETGHWLEVIDMNRDILIIETTNKTTWSRICQSHGEHSNRYYIWGTIENYNNSYGFRFIPESIDFFHKLACVEDEYPATIAYISSYLATFVGKTGYIIAPIIKAHEMHFGFGLNFDIYQCDFVTRQSVLLFFGSIIGFRLTKFEIKTLKEKKHSKSVSTQTNILVSLVDFEYKKKQVRTYQNEFQTKSLPNNPNYIIENRFISNKNFPEKISCMVSRLILDPNKDVIVSCPYCRNIAKYENLVKWLKVDGKCPICKQRLVS